MSLIKKLSLFKNLKHLNCEQVSFCFSHLAKPFNKNGFVDQKNNQDLDYFLNQDNWTEILFNLKARGLKSLEQVLKNCKSNDEMKSIISHYIDKMPNKLDTKWNSLESLPHSFQIIDTFGAPKIFQFKVKKCENLARNLGLIYLSKNDHLGVIGGHRAYSLFNDVALLEQALIDWTLDVLINIFNFTPVVVPNLVYEEVIQGCGYNPRGKASQIYKIKGKIIDGKNKSNDKTSYKNKNDEDNGGKSDDEHSVNDVCLIGTSEIPLTAFHIGQTFENSNMLPKRYCSVSRCYRAELSSLKEEAGLYRVPYFTKIEMYAITDSKQSNQMLNELVQIQKYLFSKLDLHCRIIDMPPSELSLSASRKFDIEVWLPGKRMWGEISSASNCTDFQSRRFNIQYRSWSSKYEANQLFQTNFVHTVNGTASAIPRMLIALIENNQEKDGSIRIPEVIQKYMNGKTVINKLHQFFSR